MSLSSTVNENAMHRDEIKPFPGAAEAHFERLIALDRQWIERAMASELTRVAADDARPVLNYLHSREHRYLVTRRLAAGAWDALELLSVSIAGWLLLVLPAWREVDLLSACLSGVAMLCLAGLLTFVLSRDQSAVVA